MQHEWPGAFAQGVDKQRAEESLNSRVAEDIGDAHLAEAEFLHGEEGVEQPKHFLLRVRLDAAEAAGGLELARLRAVLLAFALAADAR